MKVEKKLSSSLIVAAIAIIVSLAAGFIINMFGLMSLAIIPFLIAAALVFFFVIRNPYVGFLLIIFFLPFERVPTYNLAGLDIKINVLIGSLTLFAWILALIFNRTKWKVQPNALAIPICLFIITLALSLTQALNFTRAIEVFIFIMFTISLSIMTVNMIPNIDLLRKTVLVLFISSFFVGIFGIFQFGGDVIGLPQSITLLKEGYTSAIFGFPRIQAFSMEPLYYANYLLIPISLALAYFFGKVAIFEKKGRSGRKSLWMLVGFLALLLVNFVLTVSRGGYLGLVATLAVFTIFYLKKIFTWRNLAIIVVLILVYFGVNFALSKSQARAYQNFMSHITLKDVSLSDESTLGRLKSYDQALTIFKKNLTWGVGIGNFGPAKWGYPLQAPPTGWDIVNNEYLEIAVETGIVGLLAFASIIIVLIVRSLVALKIAHEPFLRATLIGLLAAFIGVLVQYNFFSTLYIIHIWVLIGLIVGVQNLIFRSAKLKTQPFDKLRVDPERSRMGQNLK